MQVLRKGSEGPSVELLQRRLNNKILAGIVVDGDFGPNTNTAVLNFQGQRRLVVDGIVGDKTWDALLEEVRDDELTFEVPPDLKKGDRGEWVITLQEKLNARGYGPLVEDGDYGAKTRQAVWLYQESNNLEVDDEGSVDDLTWDHLMVSLRFNPPLDLLVLHQQELEKKVGVATGEHRLLTLKIAIQDLGLKEVPNGSNGGPEIAHIVDDEGNGTPPSAYWVHWGNPTYKSMPAWCAISVSYWMKTAQGTDKWQDIPFGNWFGGCTQMMKWAQKKDCWVEASSLKPGGLMQGAAFIMPRSGSGSDSGGTKGFTPGHTGLVICDNGDGTFTTIEGNTSNAVKSRTRKVSDMMGFIYWWEA
jgi:peptidoglycan hydrolase-like protein with peptidoglycan-binding domain